MSPVKNEDEILRSVRRWRTVWQFFEACSQGLADPGGITVSPSGLDQRPARAPVVGQGQPFASHRIAARAFRRHQPRNDISWRGVSNRRTSAISAAAKVTAAIVALGYSPPN